MFQEYGALEKELHREHVELAAAHGIHIVVEKPMADDRLSLDEANETFAVASHASGNI